MKRNEPTWKSKENTKKNLIYEPFISSENLVFDIAQWHQTPSNDKRILLLLL